ncbi:FecCD family ABC transporter permease [Spongisporangium articulatum]|uniref:FecCD family ABC transporter permease n=1 Tax=Spongisporangium articulatum TaxID=3362603 RepID=A0ABW8ARG0_9ACTN
MSVDRAAVARARARRALRRHARVALLAVLVLVLFAVSLMVGRTFYGPVDVVRVVLGETVPGASFTVGELRLPRTVLGLLVGAALGLSGVTFQTMLRNALASPDIIGISSGASAAAVVGLVLLDWSASVTSVVAIVSALVTTVLIYGLSWSRGGAADSRMILIGIGFAAMLHSVISYVILQAAAWDVQLVMRWLTGSLNSADWARVAPLAVAFVLIAPLLIAQAGRLALMQHGQDSATALGVPVERTRLLAVVAAVALLAFATAAAGPVAFVAFLAGPIAARVVGGGGSMMVPAMLVGALLVLGGDLVGQYALANRYPVGVVTGAFGAPYLIYLLVRTNRAGGSL